MTAQLVCCVAGLPTLKDAERAVHAAARSAEQAVLKAGKLAAAAGLDWALPEGLDGLELPPLEKVGWAET